jgi:hypothetical protein
MHLNDLEVVCSHSLHDVLFGNYDEVPVSRLTFSSHLPWLCNYLLGQLSLC